MCNRMSKVQDFYEDDEFEDLLSSASARVANKWEDDFVTSLDEKWQEFGRRMYLSDKQQEILERIANDG